MNTTFQNFIYSIIGLIAFGFAIWMIVELADAVARATAGTVLVGLIGVLYVQLQTKKREIEARHFPKKVEGYQKFVDFLIDDLLQLGKVSKKSEEGKLGVPTLQAVKSVVEFKKTVFIWGSPQMIRAVEEFELLMGDPDKIFSVVDKMYRIMRKDLGHSDLLLKDGDLVAFLMKASEKNKVRQHLVDR